MQHSFVTIRALSTLKTSPKARTPFGVCISPSQSRKKPSPPSSHLSSVRGASRSSDCASCTTNALLSLPAPHPFEAEGKQAGDILPAPRTMRWKQPGRSSAAAGAARGPGFRPLSGQERPGSCSLARRSQNPLSAPTPNPPAPSTPHKEGILDFNPKSAADAPRSLLGLGKQGFHKSHPESLAGFSTAGKNPRTPSWQKMLSPGPALRVKRRPRGAGSALNPYFLFQMGGAGVELLQLTSAAGKPCKDPRKPGLPRTLLTAAEQGRVAAAELLTNRPPNLGLPLKSVPVSVFTSHF